MVQFTVFKGSKEGKIVKATTTREVGANEVLVKITHSGLCGTDEHYRHADMALGHEGAGVAEQVGSAVKNIKKGDSVGWGYQHNSCNDCKQCLTGHETLCAGRVMYGEANLDQASMGTHAVWDAGFLFKIPDNLAREYAAPLMCGGATVYNALRSFNGGVKPSERVGIIGIGGLGHLAIQFAAKMGCEVVVFSSTDAKKEEALSLGATEFVATKGVSELKVTAPIDHLIVTTSFQPNWHQFMEIMAPQATIYPLTVSFEDMSIPYMPIILNEFKIQGSLVAARQVHRDMLAFAAHHEIKPIIEQFPMSEEGIQEAMKKLEDGKMRYRGVIVAPQ
ncbi:hypothetical protein SS1G_10803 [Sclerotinia sclerotiorum 1980 UF-70]|uniref:Enoyl reductase (ER) domain-containing protein n=2 Tax=Sclerotinia sclerotiorum (strain ATCC 18683 / 1980 / Ss-1) TaxID=665079 RepID=A7EZN6_SCLS1|nr:hypothetical protein SS1G_10803 [Sclerotinia sclerotiorum 1980 UF-70]APA12210.1 hypothetical protein sscle_09g069800 [Sclerotinia sclerotiorum 1980 UF-70]EDN94928.1 hypothetical protein SS1G_10803 [Sclerotinia sclerotiorum 1980 UF-70]